MKVGIIFFIAAVLFTTCRNDTTVHSKKAGVDSSIWSNKYEAFDEPSSQAVASMRFYLLAVSKGFGDSLKIISIRQDSSHTLAFFKSAGYFDGPAPIVNHDTNSFKYST